MKYWYFLVIGLTAFVTSCEDVINVNLPTGKPRLIVDALIRVDTTQEYIPVLVKVTQTSNFFEEIPVTSLESILITYETTEDQIVIHTGFSSLTDLDAGSGIYTPNPNFSTEQRIRTSILEHNDVLFTMIIEHEGRKYISQTRYIRSAPLTRIEQGNETLFSKDETEVIVAFEDNPNSENFYVFDFDFSEFLVTEDTFYNGQKFEFSYFYDNELESGRDLTISVLGADRTFYNYMNQLIEQSEGPQGPFQTPTATVRGNVFDITDLDNQEVFDNVEQADVFPLGYFAIVQEFKSTITIQ